MVNLDSLKMARSTRDVSGPDYVMGHSEAEIRRLEAQAHLYDWATRAILAEAGLRPGMTVLDIGCGAGDVAMIAAGLVGPQGKVIAVDKEANVLSRAEQRAELHGYSNVQFLRGDAAAVASRYAEACDAVIGRLVLVHQRDPTALLTSVCRALRRGGIAAFCELESTDVTLRHPPDGAIWPRSELDFRNSAALWI